MDPKKLSIRLSAKGKKEEKAGKEDRRLAPMMRALKAIHSVGAPDSMNPEDLAKQRAGQELLGRLAAPMIVMKKWEPFSLKGMAAALGEAGLAPRQTPGDPLLPWRRLYQRKFGIFPASRFQADQCHWMGDPVL